MMRYSSYLTQHQHGWAAVFIMIFLYYLSVRYLGYQIVG
jgi:hypothetical protein